MMDPIPQDPAYHSFADQRSILGISNFWNVISNLPMLFIGLYGFYVSFKDVSQMPNLVTKLIPLTLCLGILTACFGSAYYHYAPTNATLFWDRLPMTLMFMPIFSLVIYDFVGRKPGEITYYLSVPFGVFSILYWQYTESIGTGDLRPYVLVQFFPMVIAPFILWLFPKKTTYVRYIVLMLLWYIVAKLAEHFDAAIYETLGFWSGHTIKHLVGAISLWYAIRLLIAWKKTLLPA